jgi:RimJ/RimL family protein N-acetyltransferase
MGGAPPTLDELTKRFESLETRRSPDGREIWLNWTVRLRQTDEAIGYTQATVVPGKVATIAYVVGSDWQDRGYGTEAVRAIVEVLDEAGVTTIRATIPSNHIASQRVAAKAGLSRTGESTSDGEDVWVLPRDDPRAPPQDIPTC